MNFIKHIRLFLIVCSLGFFSGFAQDEEENTQETQLQFTPPTPEVASLGKFIETPVSLFTGIPQIGVPLYEIQQKRFSVPISLSYHAGGIKVEDVASRVGLGWALNAGGMITRTMKKQPDDASSGYLNTPYTVADIEDYFPFESTAGQELLKGIQANTLDYEPDIFNYSFGGYSGSFYFDQETKLPVFEDYVPFRVEMVFKRDNQVLTQTHPYLDSRDHNTAILAFIITTPDGIQYHFGKAKDSDDFAAQVRGHLDIDIRYTAWQNAAEPVYIPGPNERAYISTWYLKEIYDQLSGQSVFFNYTTENPIHLTRTSEEHVIYEELEGSGTIVVNGSCSSFPPDDELKRNLLSSNADEYLVSEILFDQGKVEFINDKVDRLDLIDAKALKSVLVKDKNDRLIKSFGLNHFYTEGGLLDHEFPLDDYFPIEYSTGGKRLFLEAVHEFKISSSSDSSVDQNKPKTFSFEYYNPDALPHRFSASQDYWGFYNGAGNKNLIPEGTFVYTTPGGNTMTKTIGEADRSVSTETSKYGTMSKITYPTGGSKTFIYENNVSYETVTGSPYELKNNYFSYADISAQTILPAPEYMVYEWTIDIDISQMVTFDINAPCNSSENEFDTCPWLINFTNISGGTDINTIWTHTKTVSRNLSPGTYKIKVNYGEYNYGPPDFIGDDANIFELHFQTLELKEPEDETVLHPAGGLRINEIVYDVGEDGDRLESKKFEYTTESGAPSGVLAGRLPYFDNQITEIRCLDKAYPQGAPPRVLRINRANAHTYQSVSTIPLTQTSGSYFGNTRVTEYYGDQEIGKTVHEFSILGDRFASFPLAHLDNNAYMRGKPLSTTVYRNEDGNFIQENKVEYSYSTVNRESQQGYAIAVNSYEDLIEDPSPDGGVLNNIITYHGLYSEYEKKSRWYRLNHVITTKNDPETNEFIKDSTVFTYNEETLNKTTISRYISSFSDTTPYETTRNYYPADIGTLGTTVISADQESLIEKLSSTNRISEIVRGRIYGSGILETYNTTRFKDYGSDRVLPEYTEIYKEGYGSFITGRVLQYDNDLNPIEVQKKEDSTPTSYIWGYDGQYPIAVLQNIAYNDIPSTTINGLQSYANADDDRCTTSACKEQELREVLNELRDHFPEAMITTYTYDPLIGITSITDPKGYTSYYVYDGFNRLQYIKDADEHVLQEYEYHYKNQ